LMHLQRCRGFDRIPAPCSSSHHLNHTENHQTDGEI
jgi:hypothetical protein